MNHRVSDALPESLASIQYNALALHEPSIEEVSPEEGVGVGPFFLNLSPPLEAI